MNLGERLCFFWGGGVGRGAKTRKCVLDGQVV